jgi:hypothetical protein
MEYTTFTQGNLTFLIPLDTVFSISTSALDKTLMDLRDYAQGNLTKDDEVSEGVTLGLIIDEFGIVVEEVPHQAPRELVEGGKFKASLQNQN